VDLPAAVLTHVQDLTASIGQDDRDLSHTLVALTTALRSTATSYCGFRLTIVGNQWPVTLTAFTDGDHEPVGTSLRLPLGLVSQTVDGDSRVVFYAGIPGAFTDLAADLSHALGGIPVDGRSPTANHDGHRGTHLDSHRGTHLDGHRGTHLDGHRGTHLDGHRRVIALDVDLPPVSRRSALTGTELTLLNRATGVLIQQGHDIEQAHQLLRREAAAAGVEPHIYAARILRG
jgi:hypothetical protein